MKKLLSILAASTMLSSAALAGNIDPPVIVDVEPVAATTVDWGGFYGGLAVAAGTSTTDYFYDGVHSNGPWDGEGTVYGGFAGYNVQTGNVVFGGELSYMMGDIYSVDDEGTFSNILDAKARAGYAVGSVMVYGTVGYSSASFGEDYAAPATDLMTGFGFGVGADLMVTEKIFAGLEYYSRTLDGALTYPVDPLFSVEGNVTTITARVGMYF